MISTNEQLASMNWSLARSSFFFIIFSISFSSSSFFFFFLFFSSSSSSSKFYLESGLHAKKLASSPDGPHPSPHPLYYSTSSPHSTPPFPLFYENDAQSSFLVSAFQQFWSSSLGRISVSLGTELDRFCCNVDSLGKYSLLNFTFLRFSGDSYSHFLFCCRFPTAACPWKFNLFFCCRLNIIIIP